MLRLHNLRPAPGSRKPKLIVGRGEGSTMGQTAGKGQKGQTSRSGDSIMTGFEGGQTPLIRRIPKRGFRHPSKICYEGINIETLEKLFEAGSQIDGQALYKQGLLKNPKIPFKILGHGKLTKKFKIVTKKISSSAAEAVKKAGGELVTA